MGTWGNSGPSYAFLYGLWFPYCSRVLTGYGCFYSQWAFLWDFLYGFLVGVFFLFRLRFLYSFFLCGLEAPQGYRTVGDRSRLRVRGWFYDKSMTWEQNVKNARSKPNVPVQMSVHGLASQSME